MPKHRAQNRDHRNREMGEQQSNILRRIAQIPQELTKEQMIWLAAFGVLLVAGIVFYPSTSTEDEDKKHKPIPADPRLFKATPMATAQIPQPMMQPASSALISADSTYHSVKITDERADQTQNETARLYDIISQTQKIPGLMQQKLKVLKSQDLQIIFQDPKSLYMAGESIEEKDTTTKITLYPRVIREKYGDDLERIFRHEVEHAFERTVNLRMEQRHPHASHEQKFLSLKKATRLRLPFFPYTQEEMFKVINAMRAGFHRITQDFGGLWMKSQIQTLNAEETDRFNRYLETAKHYYPRFNTHLVGVNFEDDNPMQRTIWMQEILKEPVTLETSIDSLLNSQTKFRFSFYVKLVEKPKADVDGFQLWGYTVDIDNPEKYPAALFLDTTMLTGEPQYTVPVVRVLELLARISEFPDPVLETFYPELLALQQARLDQAFDLTLTSTLRP